MKRKIKAKAKGDGKDDDDEDEDDESLLLPGREKGCSRGETLPLFLPTSTGTKLGLVKRHNKSVNGNLMINVWLYNNTK